MRVGRRLKVATCLLPDNTSHDERSRDPASSCMRFEVQLAALGGATVQAELSYVRSCKFSQVQATASCKKREAGRKESVVRVF